MDEQLGIPGAMTVAELIARLQELDPQATVAAARLRRLTQEVQ